MKKQREEGRKKEEESGRRELLDSRWLWKMNLCIVKSISTKKAEDEDDQGGKHGIQALHG